MTIRSLLSATVAVLALAMPLTCPSAQAQAQAPAAASNPGAPSAATVALVRRLFVVLRLENQIDSMLASMLPVMLEQQAMANPQAAKVDQQMLIALTRDVMREKVTPKLIEGAVPLYAATYTDAELEQIVAFYESPGGKAFVEKAPTLGPKMADLTRLVMPEALGEMNRRLCERLKCTKPPQPAPKPLAS